MRTSNVFTALHAMQTRSIHENSVRPSLRLSVRPHVKGVTLDKIEGRSVDFFV